VYLICGVLSWTWVQSGRAQDVEPRALTAAPVGTNIAGLSLAHSWGAVLLDKTLQVEDLDGSTFSFVASYSRFIDFFGLTGRVSATVVRRLVTQAATVDTAVGRYG
jgi:hypothetical protein